MARRSTHYSIALPSNYTQTCQKIKSESRFKQQVIDLLQGFWKYCRNYSPII
jgi:hypothetical protein